MGSPGTATRMTTPDWGVLVLCAALWGSSYTFNKISLPEIPIFTIAASRLVIAAVLLHAFAHVTGVRRPSTPAQIGPFFVFTLFSNVLPFIFILFGQRETSSGLTAVLGATTPLFLIPLAHLLTADEKMLPRKVVGVLVGLAGVVIVFGMDAFTGWSTSIGAKLSIIFGAFLYAVGAIYSKRFVGHHPIAIAATQMTCGALLSLPLALVIDRPWLLPVPSAPAITALLATAVLGSALSSVLYFHVLLRGGATIAMLTTLLVPVAPILLGAIFLGEHLHAREAAGTLLIATALLIIDGRLAAWVFSKTKRQPA